VDVVAAGDVAERFAPVAAAYGLAPLVRGELERSAQALPARLGPRAAFASAGADQFALELRQPAEHGEHQTPVRSRRVGPCAAPGPGWAALIVFTFVVTRVVVVDIRLARGIPAEPLGKAEVGLLLRH
jgi:hypothetical protein